MSAKRTHQTLLSIIAQRKHLEQLPYLTAVSTIYQNLLAQNAPLATWQLFMQVASMPLLTTRLEYSCVAQGNMCERHGNSGHCQHKLVNVPHMVYLAQPDCAALAKGAFANNTNAIAQHFGAQLSQVLAGTCTV